MATNVRFPDPLKLEGQAYAERIGISFNALLSVALREYLDRRLPSGPGPGAAEPIQPAPAPAVGPAYHFFPGHRNSPCKCGSGLKFKECHGRK